MTNVTNPASPISPINQSISTVPVTESVIAVETPQKSLQTVTSQPENTPKTSVEAPQTNNNPAPISSPSQSENNASASVPKGKELVPGFGLVMSLDLINAPINFQQQQLDIALDYSQELPDGIRGNQEFLTELITQGGANRIFDIGGKRWNDLYRNYEVQPGY